MGWVELISTISAAIAALFAGIQIYLSRREHDREFIWRKNDRAFSYSIFKNPEYRTSRDFIRNIFGSLAGMKKTISLDQIDSMKQDHPDLVFHIFACISHWGRMSTEIRLDLINEDVAFDLHAPGLTDLYVAFEPFVERRLSQDPQSYRDFKSTATRWIARRKRNRAPRDQTHPITAL